MLKKTISGIMLTLLLTSMLIFAFNIQPVRASETIYIMEDGSIDPPDAPINRDGDLYTFTDNIYDKIVVERSNIIIDGTGHKLQGSESGYGYSLSSSTNNVTVRNTNIENFLYGIWISGNYCTIFANNITKNKYNGIEVHSSFNIISGNDIINNGIGGIHLYTSCNNNTISGNTIASNGEYGIDIYTSCNNNTISENNIRDNYYNGIRLFQSCSNNIILGNNLTNNRYGVNLDWSCNNNIVSGNIIENSIETGIGLGPSSFNIITENTMGNNGFWDLGLFQSSNNKIYHNNFIGSAQHVSIQTSGYANIWDDSYPSGGNYWSDYGGVDANGDRIGDTPYIIDADNQDRYPLMNLWSPIPPPWVDWNHYHNYTEIVNTLLYLNASYPNIVDVFSIGKSWQNRDIYCIRLTNETNTHQKPKLFFVGYHHAREPISAELPLYFAVEAATNFGTNETITHMLNYSEIYIVPALNVDGLNAVKQNEWQRKNVHPFDEDNDTLLDEDPPDDADGDGYIEDLFYWNGTYYEFIRWEGIDNDGDSLLNEDWVGGVDLNRNYGWNTTYAAGSPNPQDETYRGPEPFSEPETRAIRDLVLTHGFKYALSFHSGAEYIGYGYGNSEAHNRTFLEVAENLSILVSAPYYLTGFGGLPSGTFNDWMYGNKSTFAFTCEIYTNNSAWQYEPGPDPYTWWEKGIFQFFNPDPSQIETVIQRWLPVFTYIANRAITEAYNISTTNITPLKTVLGQGYTMNINVTVANQGDYEETFNVTLYANTTAITTQTLTLTSGSSTTITFTWNTTGFAKGNYTISAYAWPVPGETDTDDNRFTGGVVTVTVAGDLDGDFEVRLVDLVTLARAYGSKPGDPPWNPNADLDDNGVVGLADLVIMAKNYGKTDP